MKTKKKYLFNWSRKQHRLSSEERPGDHGRVFACLFGSGMKILRRSRYKKNEKPRANFNIDNNNILRVCSDERLRKRPNSTYKRPI